MLVACAMALAACSTEPTVPAATAPAATASSVAPSAAATVLLRPGAARRALDALVRASGGLPVIKVDISADAATLSALDDGRVVAWRWAAGVVTPVESDIKYIRQASFDPDDYAVDQLPRILAQAAQISGSRSNQELQIVEYDQGQVLMTVTTRPESMPVFFRADGSPINRLDFTTADGFAEAIRDTAGNSRVLAMGWDADGGFWADTASPGEPDVVDRTTRQATVPGWRSARKADSTGPTFPASQVDPAVLARLVRELPAAEGRSGGQVSFEVSRKYRMALPVITWDVAGTTVVTTLSGTDVTSTVGG